MTRQEASSAKTDAFPLAVGFVVVLALAVRMWGITYGLPILYNVDEGQFIPAAVRFGSGDLNPHNFIYPTFFKYFLFILYGLYFLTGKAIGVFASVEAFRASYFVDPSAFYVIARGASAILGGLTVLLVYISGRSVHSRLAGLLAASMFAFDFIHVQYSHYALPDVTMTFLFVLGILFALRIVENGRLSDYVIAGACGGLSISTKYNGVAIVAGIFLAHILRNYQGNVFLSVRRDARSLAIAMTSLVTLFLIGTPFALADYRTFISDIEFQNVVISQKQTLVGFAATIWGYLKGLFLPVRYDLLGNYLGVFAILAPLYYVWRFEKRKFLISAVILIHFVFFAFKTSASFLRPHYMLPLLPLAYILSGSLITEIARKVRGHVRPLDEIRPFAFAAVAAVLFIGPATRIVVFDIARTRIDTGNMARHWVERNIPSGSRILHVGTRGLGLKQTEESMRNRSTGASTDRHQAEKAEAFRRYQGKKYYIEELYQGWGFISEERAERIAVLPRGIELVDRSRMSLEYWRSRNFEYVVVMGKLEEDDFNSYVKKLGSEFESFLSALDSKCALVREFIPDYPAVPGVIVRIYKVGESA